MPKITFKKIIKKTMKKFLTISLVGLVFVLAGCAKQTPTTTDETGQPKTDISQPSANVNEPKENIDAPKNETPENKAPQITSAVFNGNGVVIQGKNLSGSFVAFTHPTSTTGESLCREMITPSCVLQKAVSTDTTIKFISNWIGGNGSYEIYVENPTTGASNKVVMPIPAR